MIKKMIAMLTAAVVLCTTVAAAGDKTAGFELVVNDREITNARAYQDGNTIMVPLRAVAEALGYRVEWDEKNETASAEDSIQSVAVRENDNVAVFTGKLKIINLTHDLKMERCAVMHEDRIYVPAEMFADFLNDVSQEDNIVRISPQMCELEENAAK